MAGGLVGLLDDVAALAKLAAERELPIIKRIAVGSLRNKLLFITPAALLLSEIAPTVVEIILMFGGCFLAYEGAHKVLHALKHDDHDHDVPVAAQGADAEASTISGAIRTDFILSAEIMVIALKEVIDEPLLSRAVILAIVGVVITVAVYGVVAAIVKMDDIGLSLAQRTSRFAQKVGRGLVTAMPKVLAALSAIGTVAMLWVGGHILLVGTDDVGWHAPYGLVHHAEEFVHHAVQGVGGLLAWLVNTAASAVVGLIVGAVVVAIVNVLPFRRRGEH